MNEYPSDLELELFIEELEKQELYAPKHLKEKILTQAFPEQTGGSPYKNGKESRNFQNLSYRLKIIAGMAAAVLMLMALPSMGIGSGYGVGAGRDAGQMKMQAESGQTGAGQLQARADGEDADAGSVQVQADGTKGARQHQVQEKGTGIWSWHREGSSQTQADREVDINFLVNESTWKINQKINFWFGMISGSGNVRKMDDGGNIYEN